MELADKLEIHAQWLGHLHMDEASVDLMQAAIRLREHDVAAAKPEAPLSKSDLKQMMQDPRYWKKRDPDFIQRVADGFRILYGDE